MCLLPFNVENVRVGTLLNMEECKWAAKSCAHETGLLARKVVIEALAVFRHSFSVYLAAKLEETKRTNIVFLFGILADTISQIERL